MNEPEYFEEDGYTPPGSIHGWAEKQPLKKSNNATPIIIGLLAAVLTYGLLQKPKSKVKAQEQKREITVLSDTDMGPLFNKLTTFDERCAVIYGVLYNIECIADEPRESLKQRLRTLAEVYCDPGIVSRLQDELYLAKRGTSIRNRNLAKAATDICQGRQSHAAEL
jgi:hypothetical protein